MSEVKNAAPGASPPGNISFFSRLRDTSLIKDSSLLLAWIAGLLLIAALIWVLTQPMRSRFLLNAVNRVLEESGDSRQLGEQLPSGARNTSASLFMDTWYTLKSGDGSKAVVFAFIGEGFFFPCAAVVDSGGKVEDFIPLGTHSEKTLKQVSPGILKIYVRRIEGGRQ